jgi:hypothetical protein
MAACQWPEREKAGNPGSQQESVFNAALAYDECQTAES